MRLSVTLFEILLTAREPEGYKGLGLRFKDVGVLGF
jgi:hypothetical protein